MPKFCVSQYTTDSLSFEEDLALYTQTGVDGIDVAEEKLSTDHQKAREQLRLLASTNLCICNIQPKVLSLFPFSYEKTTDLKFPEARMERFRRTIDLFTDCLPGRELLFTTTGGMAPGYNFRFAHETARSLYRDLTDYAAERGAKIMFESLNPMFMNVNTFICTLQEAIKLVEDVGRENFGLLLDVWHVWWEHGLAERISGLKDIIFGVHISDWPENGPRGFGDRLIPGDGVIDLAEFLGAVERSGFDGGYCLEVFSSREYPDSLSLMEPAELIGKSMEGFRKAWDLCS